MTVKNAMEFIVLCENRLGYLPDPTKPLWRARSVQASRINKERAKNPGLLTWHNLELAVEHMYRMRQPIKSPIYVLHHVKDAVALAATPVSRPLGDLIDEAIATEQAQRPSREQQSWIGQLTRAVGSYRQAAYDEWHAERGHLLRQEVAA